MVEEYKVDYDELRKIYRQESKSPQLTKINPSFYKALKKFVAEERNKYLNSVDSLSPLTLKKLENLKQMVEKIRDLRLKKCMNLCLMYSRTNDIKDDNLIDVEIDFVKDILKLIDKQIEYTNALLGVSKKDIKKDGELNFIKVKFIEKIPAFIGADMKEYGPFDVGDIGELPEDVFSILEPKGLVKKI
ncbi:MAG TPA: hypothetical protein PKK56_00495 [archaeon]|nr:hypothetical protein [archaeon]HRT02677.1 hypothetical protein [Candidatus Diapherotrites archaeon]